MVKNKLREKTDNHEKIKNWLEMMLEKNYKHFNDNKLKSNSVRKIIEEQKIKMFMKKKLKLMLKKCKHKDEDVCPVKFDRKIT